MEEVWKEIKGFENEYLISNFGNVKSIARFDRYNRWVKEKILKPRKHTGGYLRVQIHKKDFYIHRLVANAFIENPDNKEFVNHKDGNKQNNRVDNLEWCTALENNIHAIETGLHKIDSNIMSKIANCENHKKAMKKRRKFNDEQIKEIRNSNETDTVLSRIYNTSRGQIYSIRNYKTYKEV